MQHMTAADRVASDHRHDGLGHGADLALHIKDVQARDAILADVAALTAHALIATSTEGVLTLASEDDDADALVVTGVVKGSDKLLDRTRAEGVSDARTVEGDLGDPLLALLVLDVLEARVLDGYPGDVAHGVSSVRSARWPTWTWGCSAKKSTAFTVDSSKPSACAASAGRSSTTLCPAPSTMT